MIGNIFLGALYIRSLGQEALVVADTPGPVGVSDLPSLADQIGVGANEAPAILGVGLVAPPKTPIKGSRKPRALESRKPA